MSKKKKILLLILPITFILMWSITAHSVQYSYDQLYRLVQVNRDDGSTTVYEYDDLGNRLSIVTTTSSSEIVASFTASPTNGAAPLEVMEKEDLFLPVPEPTQTMKIWRKKWSIAEGTARFLCIR